MAINVWEYTRDEIEDEWCDSAEYPTGLWWSDFEEAGVEKCFIAWIGDEVVGWQTVNIDGLCVGIEVKTRFQGQGVARALIKESGCRQPADDQNPDFWESVA